MDYAQLADRDISHADDMIRNHADAAPAATVIALTGIGYALLHLAETVARLEK